MDIRQRILENSNLTLQQAYDQARVLDLAEQYAKHYDTVAVTSKTFPPILASQSYEAIGTLKISALISSMCVSLLH